MSAAATLEGLGLVLDIADDGKLTIAGLKRLSDADRGYAFSVAKEHKPSILRELRRREYEAFLRTTCRAYWIDCLECPDAQLAELTGGLAGAYVLDFCKRHALNGGKWYE